MRPNGSCAALICCLLCGLSLLSKTDAHENETLFTIGMYSIPCVCARGGKAGLENITKPQNGEKGVSDGE